MKPKLQMKTNDYDDLLLIFF